MAVRIINADVFSGLAQLEDESVQCVVTSPPYWGLRDYGTAKWEGGDTSCDHLKPAAHGYAPHETSTLGLKRDGISPSNSAHSDAVKRQQFRDKCGKCGAIRIDSQLGLEPTLSEHITKMVAVFAEVHRVLRKDGTLWLNYGDCYATSVNGRSAADTKAAGKDDRTFRDKPFSTIGGVLKPKDLCMIPNRLAIALQEAGWWVRSEIIWAKPNPMPESTRDRPTSSHEKIWLLTKSQRYFYDAEAIKEDVSVPDWDNGTRVYGGANEAGANLAHGHRTSGRLAVSEHRNPNGKRNKRNVWPIATTPYSEAHFATFPLEIPELCIKAGSRPGDMILDPFGGAGTAGLVADQLGRNCILIELNPEYASMAERRIYSNAPLFADVGVEIKANKNQLELDCGL